jgi:hypothetical protein
MGKRNRAKVECCELRQYKHGSVPSQLRLPGSIASPAASGSSGGEDSRGREGSSGGEDSIASSSEAIGCRGGVGGDMSRAVALVRSVYRRYKLL